MQLRAVSWMMLGVACISARGAVLPDDRTDVMYHDYNGGGMDIHGPSILVRKSVAQDLSIDANYYVDEVSSASIDVQTSASPYSEKRVQTSVGADYLHDKSIYSLNYIRSDENDYSARTFDFGLSQDFFGDLTTLSMGYTLGYDDVYRTGDPAFHEKADRHSYRLGLTQVLTPNWLFSVAQELISDEGYLNNPYRSVRYRTSTGYSFEPERYPRTRTSDSTAVRSSYYLPWRAAVHGEYRWFADSWGINAHDWQLRFVQPLPRDWQVEVRYRQYSQTHADFYSDLFPYENSQNFLARDKELSTFDSDMFGLGIGYETLKGKVSWIDKVSMKLFVDYYRYHYANFRDIRVSTTPGTEPLYGFNATVTRFWVTAWY